MGEMVLPMGSTVTAKVSGLTSIFGVPAFRTMSRLPILRVLRTAITCRSRPRRFLIPAECAAPETKVTQVMDFARQHQHPLRCTLEKD